MNDVPSGRFGFTAPAIASDQYSERLPPDSCCRSMGDEHWADVKRAEYEHLPALLAYLVQAPTLEDVPRELLDLRQDNAEISGPWAVDVRPERLNGTLFYVVRPREALEGEKSLYILLPSAATTLQIIRMGWSDTREIVFHLLGRGVEFRLCFQAPLRPEPPLLQHHNTRPGLLPAGYKFTHGDYTVYVERRNEFLHSPRGRAARFACGIIGRLARRAVEDDIDRLRPSDEVFVIGVRLWDGESPTAYWDDNTLTPEEVDLICGAHPVATGRGLQEKILYWWPKPRAFHHSGLNVGWWTPDCERWFEKRLAQIDQNINEAQLWTEMEWKSKIRFFQKSRQVALANERIAAEYLG
ncbi:hypothetical protein C8R44DRAFT_772716 [Mycena epipterygia]|nr:hypothetical protein C8R44DRAFT_772716 [Mycena epipterygia]